MIEKNELILAVRSSYLVRMPERVLEPPLVVVIGHGYGMNAVVMLEIAAPVVPSGAVIASVQGPHPFFVGERTSCEPG